MGIKMKTLFVPQILDASEREAELREKVVKLENKLREAEIPVAPQEETPVEIKGKTTKKR